MGTNFGNIFPSMNIIAKYPISIREKYYLLTIMIVMLIFYSTNSNNLAKIINLAEPVALIAVLLSTVLWSLKVNKVMLWSPLIWFRLASVAYFGFGALVPYIVNSATKQMMWYNIIYNDRLILKFNIVVLLGILIVLVTADLLLKTAFRPIVKASPHPLKSNGNALVFGCLFLGFGMILKYFIVLPYWISGIGVLPGIFMTLSNVIYGGFFLLVYYSQGRSAVIKLVVLSLIVFDLLISTVMFAKTPLLMNLIFSILGFLTYKFTVKRAIITTILVISIFSLAQPLIEFGRLNILQKYGGLAGGSIQERFDIVRGYFKDFTFARADSARRGVQSTLARISYTNIGVMVIQEFDNYFPGDTLRYIVPVLIPRIIWRNKPIITTIGSDVYYMQTGQVGSSTGQSLFTESYWNMGWIGLPVLMIPVGIILAIFARFSFHVISKRDWFYLPIVFFGVNIGIRVDGYFVADVIGASWIALWVYLLLLSIRILAANVGLRKCRETPNHLRDFPSLK